MLRETAIRLLQEAVPIDEVYCRIQKVKVRITEKDILLNQLLEDEDYLSMPLALYFYSPFWRELKAESNKCCIAKQSTQEGNENV